MSVDEAKRFVALKSPATVDEAEDMKPVGRASPVERTEKSVLPAAFVKRTKSPVAFAVEEACIKMVSVEVPATARSACAAS